MIRTLRVRNLAVIEELELELGPGLNVITGETGAGKSVLLGAISLLRGQRASSDAIRSGADEARVEAILEDAALCVRARELDLPADGGEGGELLVVRTVSRSGRGRVRVNGALATASLLGDLLGEELEVTGQGEHQRLLAPEVQAELLDESAGLGEAVAELGALHRRWRELGAELGDRRARAEEWARRCDQLRFEIDQIDAAELAPGEPEQLELERARLGHADRLGQEAGTALDALEGEEGARDRVAAAAGHLGAAQRLDPSLEPALAALERARLELEEGGALLQTYLSDLEADPLRLERVEARLAEIDRLRARYGSTAEAILEHRDRARAELERIGGGEARDAELERELAEHREALEESARLLGKARAEAASRLEADVTREIRALHLPRARFEVRLEPLTAGEPTDALGVGNEGRGDPARAPCGPRGAERARFLLSANPGEDSRALRASASGGELARLMLALRNALREADRGRVLLFDEVDAGVGGRTAHALGERLRRLSRRHQVLCITHLPQIAALGERHLCLTKSIRRGRAETRVLELTGDARVEEIARMAGGGRITPAARAHARELLAGA